MHPLILGVFAYLDSVPEEALTADYCPGSLGLLKDCDLEEYQKAEPESLNAIAWRHHAGFYERGERLVEYDHRTSTRYLLFRGDRLVWQNMAFRINYGLHASLRRNTNKEKFIALGNTKGFLNGDFIWPPEDWVNPVTDEQEKAYDEEHRQSFKKRLIEAKAES
jgi:hypothetical protein